MKLIMQSEFDNLRLNANHEYDIDTCGNKQVIKIYCNNLLIAKKITQKKSVRYLVQIAPLREGNNISQHNTGEI